MPLITAPQLRLFAPNSDYMTLAPKLSAACEEVGIDTPREIRHFMAQMHHESMGFTRLVESLNYSAERLVEVWPKRFPTLAAAKPYAHNPRALAEKVYGGRMGNKLPGDGSRYIGRSWTMVTGADGYAQAGPWVGLNLLKNPTLAQDPGVASRIAAHWWVNHRLNQIVAADPGERAMANIDAHILANEIDDCRQARRVINGGNNGIEDAIKQLRRAAVYWPG